MLTSVPDESLTRVEPFMTKRILEPDILLRGVARFNVLTGLPFFPATHGESGILFVPAWLPL